MTRLYRRLALMLAAVLPCAVLAAGPAVAATRADQWQAIAVTALTRFKAQDDGKQRSNTYAWALESELRLNGDTAYARKLLNKLYSQRKSDGGWGLPFAYDALSNGTVNNADTTYTVTLAGHVGPPLLYAQHLGMDQVTAPDGTVWSIRAQIQRIVYLLMTTPHIDTAQGMCLAYSRNPNDTLSYGCVHNASAGAAKFLMDANAAGFGRGGLSALVEGITRRETYAYIVGPITVNGVTRTNWWRYMDTTSLNDCDHNSYDGQSMYFLAPMIGQNVAWMHMHLDCGDNTNAPMAHMAIATLPAVPGRTSPDGTAIWCALADPWITEVQATLNAATDLQRVAQVAQGAARVADNCR